MKTGRIEEWYPLVQTEPDAWWKTWEINAKGTYSRDFARAMRVARQLDVGVVLGNHYFRGLLGTPFGGCKASGHGREHWAGTLREWSRIKNIRFPGGQGEIPVWRGATAVLTQAGWGINEGVKIVWLR